MAYVFLVNCTLLLAAYWGCQSPQTLPFPMAVERSWIRLRSSLIQRSGIAIGKGFSILRSRSHLGQARRNEAIFFRLRSTSCFSANGFSWLFSCFNRRLVC